MANIRKNRNTSTDIQDKIYLSLFTIQVVKSFVDNCFVVVIVNFVSFSC